jgi:GT2 family glycosyltransferase
MNRECLERIVEYMEANPSVGEAQPKIMNMADGRINAFGGIVDYYGRTWHLGEGEIDYGQYDAVTDIFYAQGAAVVVRRELAQKIGLFDPIYFMYYEETDLSWRAWLAGYRVTLIPKAVVHHYGGAAFKSMDSTKVGQFKLYLHRKNHIITLLKNYSMPNVIRYALPFVIKMLLIASLWTIKGEKGRSLAYFKSLWWIGSHLPLIIIHRAAVQKLRKRSDKEIMRMMRPT